MITTEGWPPYKEFGSAEHLQALGAVACIWNGIERWYQAFLQMLLPSNDVTVASRIFALLGNEDRPALIRSLAENALSPDEFDALDYFLTCAAKCKEVRNVLLHGDFFHVRGPNKIGFAKGARKRTSTSALHHYDVAGLRAIADEHYRVYSYGLQLLGTLTQRRAVARGAVFRLAEVNQPLPLPDKPPQPRNWEHHSLGHPGTASLQPGS